MAQTQQQKGARGSAQRGGALIVQEKDFGPYLAQTAQKTIQRLLPRGVSLTPPMVIAQGLSAIKNDQSKDRLLSKCSIDSIANSLYYAAAVGLELGTPRGHSYLVPYGGKCTYQIGYKGLIELAYRSGKVKTINAQVVHDGDSFVFSQGAGPNGSDVFEFTPNRKNPSKDWYTTFMRVIFADGGFFIHEMLRHEIEAVRDKSVKGKDNDGSPWKTYPEEMYKKTVIKRGLKTLNLSPTLSAIIGLDDSTEANQAQDILDLQDWEVVEPGSLPSGRAPAQIEAAGEEGGHHQDPQTEPEPQDPRLLNELYCPPEGEGLKLERNFSPDDQKWILQTCQFARQWAPKRLNNIFGPGAGNRAHIEGGLARWKDNIKTLMDMLEEMRVEAQGVADASPKEAKK